VNTTLKYVIPFLAVICLAYYCSNRGDSAIAQGNQLDVIEDEKINTDKTIVNTDPIKEDLIKKQAESTTTKETIKPETKPAIKATEQKPNTKPNVKAKPPIKRVVKQAKISFEEPTFDFGEITEGDIIKHQFKFKNTGNAELVIHSAKASCGCTDPSYPFLGIAPGEEGYIGVTYNSVSKDGPQKPDILIKTNAAKDSIALYLSGIVKAKEKEEERDTISNG